MTVSQAKYIGPKTRRVEKATKKILKITCKSDSDGKDVAGVISSVYGVKVNKLDSVGGAIGLGIVSAWLPLIDGWQTFRAIFPNADEADKCMASIREAINQYGSGSDYEDPTTFIDDGDDPYAGGGSGDPSGNGNGNGNGKEADWLTYVVIGAAVVIIALLLWSGSRKK